MKTSYIYTCVEKESGVAIQDMTYSRSEAREISKLYESLYKTKVVIQRFVFDKKVR
jgi:hypothetical protein